MSEQNVSPVGCGFWLWWLLASSVGLAVGGPVGRVVTGLTVGRVLVGLALSGAVCGPLVGALQWLVLRGKISQAGWWVLASSVGWAVGWFVGVLVLSSVGLAAGDLVSGVVFGLLVGMVNFAVSGAVCGLLVGALQWLVLRGKISQAGWWVLASSVGWAVGWFVLGPVALLTSGLAGDFVTGVVLGSVGGSITGGALVWLLRHHIPDAAGAIEVE